MKTGFKIWKVTFRAGTVKSLIVIWPSLNLWVKSSEDWVVELHWLNLATGFRFNIQENE